MSCSTMDNNIVSFVDDKPIKKEKKNQYLKRKRKGAVKVRYNSSGSEGDVESDEDENLNVESSGDHIVQNEEIFNDTKPIPGAGWADAMAKILGKSAGVTTTSVVLAKSKTYQKAKEEERKENLTRIQENEERKKKIFMGRAKPNPFEREKERKFQRIATRGVVQLFNAVKQQQKLREEKLKDVGSSEKKRVKVEQTFTKGAFVDMLKGTKVKKLQQTETQDKKSQESKPAWSVLRDDFMMGANMKDWDKEQDTDEEQYEKAGIDGDVDLSSESDEED